MRRKRLPLWLGNENKQVCFRFTRLAGSDGCFGGKNASIFVAAFGCEGFDVEKIDAYASQLEAIAATISKNASSAIESFKEFDVTNVGVPKKFKPFLIGIAR